MKKSGSSWSKWLLAGLGLLVILLLPLGGSYVRMLMTFIGIYFIITLGICLLMGYAGQVSLGQAAFYGLGAYTSAILATRWEVSPWLSLISGCLLCGLIAFVIGWPLLKLPGHMLAIATLIFNTICYTLFVELTFLTGGTTGLGGIPAFSLGGLRFQAIHDYYLVWVIALVLLIISRNLVMSKTGRALRSIHRFFGGSEVAAQSLGVHIGKLKSLVFAISAVYAAIAGNLYAHTVGCITPEVFTVWFSLVIVLMAVVGGIHSLWGALIGSVFYLGAKEVLAVSLSKLAPGATKEYEVIIFALLFIILLRFLPLGLVQFGAVIRKFTSTHLHKRVNE
jgi:branched-chain amino acid transport system permease protein